MNSHLLLRVAAFSCVMVLLFHSLKFLGVKRTFLIFGVGFAIFLLFAKSERRFNEYALTKTFAELWGVPLIFPVGWLFTTYCSFYAATSILTLMPRKRDRVFSVLALSLFCVSCIALAMEVTGTHAGWWKWNLKPGENGPAAMVGWMHHTLAFYPWFLILFCTKYRHLPFYKKAFFFFLFAALAPVLPVAQIPLFGGLVIILIIYVSARLDALKLEDTFVFKK